MLQHCDCAYYYFSHLMCAKGKIGPHPPTPFLMEHPTQLNESRAGGIEPKSTQ